MSNFNDSFLYPIDVNRAAQEQCGKNYTSQFDPTAQHLWSWTAVCGGYRYSLDMARAATLQHGPGFVPVSIGVHAYDWRVYNPSLPANFVQPILMVSCDKFGDIEGVRIAIENLKSALTTIQNWYKVQVGKTFALLAPLIFYSPTTSATWKSICQSTLQPETRFSLQEKIESEFHFRNPKMQYVVGVMGGEHGAGSSNRGGITALPPFDCTIFCHPTQFTGMDQVHKDVLYAIGHELGHGFGLEHSDVAKDPGWETSIMQCGWHNYNTCQLTTAEQFALINSRYFK